MRSLLLGGVLGGLWGAGYIVASIIQQDGADLQRAITEPELAPILLPPIGLGALLGGLTAGGSAGIAVTFVHGFVSSSAWQTAIAPIAAFGLCLVVTPDFVIDPAAVEGHEVWALFTRAFAFRVVPAVIAAISVWVSMRRVRSEAN